MVFLAPIFSSSFNRGFQRIQLPALLLCANHVASTNQPKLFYVFNFAVVYMVQKRNLRCKAAVRSTSINRCVGHKNPYISKQFYSSIAMCPLQKDNNQLIEKYKTYYRRSGSVQYYKDALFVLGPMGSGKTTFIQNKILSHKMYGKYAYVDTDEIMEQLPGFSKMEVNKFYPRARQIAIILTDWLLENQLSFVAEGTCVQYEELIDYMIRLKRKGYTIKVCKLNQVELDLVLKRAANREARKMAMNEVKEIFIQSKHGLEELYRINSETTIFENISLDEL